jgi:NADPH-dependent 2,4-dienoyl-CoA reductase/sulfur reductase-like enzyme
LNRPVNILVIGGVAAGPSAAAKAKRINPDATVTLVEAGADVSYGVCELPYLISKEFNNPDDLVIHTAEELAEKKDITVLTRHIVEEIKPVKRIARIKAIESGKVIDFQYDRVILATGATAKSIPQIPSHVSNCFHYTTLNQARTVLEFIDKERPRSVCIIGAGFIGMEAAEAFVSRGLEVTMLFRSELPFPYIEHDGRVLVKDILTASGITLLGSSEVTGVELEGKKIAALRTNQGSVKADLYIQAIGFSPNIKLAREAGIKLGNDGAIVTDQRQMTSIDGVYACGDCTEVMNLVTRKTQMMPFASLASRTGQVAGENAAGGAAIFRGVIPVSALHVFGYEIAQAGNTSTALKDYNFVPVQEQIHSKTRVGFMPGAESIFISLGADRRTGRLLNATIIAKEHASQRINTVALAIRHQLTVDQFLESDFVYTPRLSPLWDPLLIAAKQLKKKISS